MWHIHIVWGYSHRLVQLQVSVIIKGDVLTSGTLCHVELSRELTLSFYFQMCEASVHLLLSPEENLQ